MANRAPTFRQRYSLGVQLNHMLDTDCQHCTYDDIARELGITRQNAYTEVVLALGAFALAWYARFGQHTTNG